MLTPCCRACWYAPQCKPLALAGDSRLVAAELAYRATKNEADLIGTFKIIIEGAN